MSEKLQIARRARDLLGKVLDSQATRAAGRTLRRHFPKLRDTIQPTLAAFDGLRSFNVMKPEQEAGGERPRLLIDVSATAQMYEVTGIQRTVKELTAALMRRAAELSVDPTPVYLKREHAVNWYCAPLQASPTASLMIARSNFAKATLFLCWMPRGTYTLNGPKISSR